MSKRPCLEAGCPRFASYRGRCQHHNKQREQQTRRLGKAVYGTKRWKVLRRHKLFLDPLCEADGCTSLATDVHHRHGVVADPWSLDGLESLCHSHHSQVTRRAQLTTT